MRVDPEVGEEAVDHEVHVLLQIHSAPRKGFINLQLKRILLIFISEILIPKDLIILPYF